MKIVSELMSRELVTLTEAEELSRAEGLLQQRRIRHLPVVRAGKLVGLITHRDLLRVCATRGAAAQSVRAGDVMNREVQTVAPDTPLREAVQRMLVAKYGCLPVTLPDGTLVGLLTEADLVRYAGALISELDRRSEARSYD